MLQAAASSGSSPGATCAIPSAARAGRWRWGRRRWSLAGSAWRRRRWSPQPGARPRRARPASGWRSQPLVVVERLRTAGMIAIGRRAAADAPGRAVRHLHGLHRHLDLRRVSRHRRAHHRAVGDVGLRGRSQGEDPRHQGRRGDRARPTSSPFTDWEAVERQDRRHPRAWSASMPYIETEVIIKHATNPAGMGIILRGIDPGARRTSSGSSTRCRRGRSPTSSTRSRSRRRRDPARQRRAAARQRQPAVPAAAARRRRPKPAASRRRRQGRRARGHAEKLAPPPPRPVLPGILLGDELYAAHAARLRRQRRRHRLPDVRRRARRGRCPSSSRFRVAGHFYTGMYEFDSKLAYVDLADAQKFLGMPGEVTGIEIRTTTPEDARAVADEIARRLARLRGPHLGGAEPGPVRGAQAGEGGDVRGAHLHRAGGVVLDHLEPDHAGDREGPRGGDPEVDGRARRRHPARLLRRGALHRDPRAWRSGSAWASAAACCCRTTGCRSIRTSITSRSCRS